MPDGAQSKRHSANERLPGAEPWREDGDGEYMALHFRGHIDLADAEAAAWAWAIDYERDVKLAAGGARHTWLRKVPWHQEDEGSYGGWDGSMQYVLSGPGPGATAVTYVPFKQGWDHVCALRPACFNHAVIGVPVADFKPFEPEFTYYCREHYVDYERRVEAAMRRLATERETAA